MYCVGSNGEGRGMGDVGYVLRGTRRATAVSAVMVRGMGWGTRVMYCVGSNGEGHEMGDGCYVLCRQ